MKKKRTKISNKNIVSNLVKFLQAIMSVLLCLLLAYMNLLPTKYFIIILLVLFVYNLIVFLLFRVPKLKKKIRNVLNTFSTIVLLILMIINFYLLRTIGVLNSNEDSKYKIENYSVIVLKKSVYEQIDDLNNAIIAYYKNTDGAEAANDKIRKMIDAKFEEYNSTDNLTSDLLNKNVDSIVIEDSILNLIKEEHSEFQNSTKVIYKFQIKVKNEAEQKDVNVTKEPFAIYISGIDTYGKISSVSRSDVNIVMVVNPASKQILLISIPRDYYVQLHGTTGTKDKLTHAGIYGIDMSIKTIEDLLETDINYYLKVNFTSVEDIVDAIGGVEVYSEYTFTSYSNYSFKKGYNKVDGKKALDFARTRKAFASGDRQRGKNQEALLEAIINKATSKSIITKYNSLLNSIDGKYETNMSSKKITSLIKMQLSDMATWNITSISLEGYDSKNYTYTYNQLLYVMEPYVESVDLARDLVDKTISGEKLEKTYTINYNNVTINKNNIQTNTVKDEKEEEPKNEENIETPDLSIEDEEIENSENSETITDDINKEESSEEENNDVLLPPESTEGEEQLPTDENLNLQ